MSRYRVLARLALVGLAVAGCEEGSGPPDGAQDDPAVGQGSAAIGSSASLAAWTGINDQLAGMGLGIAVASIDFFTIGGGRPSARLFQTGARWVPNDTRRLAQGEDITYLVDRSQGSTTSGLSNLQTEAAIDRAIGTWDSVMSKVALVKRPDSGADPDIFDWFYGFGAFGNPFLADVVNAGWLPRAFFEAVGGPGGGRGILAFSVTFVFTHDDGTLTDINGDNYADTALNEVYYNDTFGDPASDRADRPWAIDLPPPAIDVETVALHESGHSLGIDHFGPPPAAVMNPVYSGIQHSPSSTDVAAIKTLWSSWPNP